MKIIGIDPAPGKKSYVFDGQVCKGHSAESLQAYLIKQNSGQEDVLLCWDAPLTGPKNPDSNRFEPSDHTQRGIETFFRKSKWDFKAPKGISVQGYSGCSHWSITRRLIGLPRVGPWDADYEELPFKLICSGPPPAKKGKYIVEVHPAVALWLWCKNRWNGDWEYKRSKSTLNDLWTCFCEAVEAGAFLGADDDRLSTFTPQSDDEFDAYIAWLLGKLWVENTDRVVLLGSKQTGSFLLPNVPNLLDQWHLFLRETENREI